MPWDPAPSPLDLSFQELCQRGVFSVPGEAASSHPIRLHQKAKETAQGGREPV